ncbi:MAG: TrkH family potassium uptake protein [Saprospiraceae bacterium]|nr:TrkH family potassium uptake protein [Saprospiraceae bacterium]
MINTKIIINVLGVLLMMLSGFMALSMVVSLVFDASDAMSMGTAGLVTFLTGFVLWLLTRNAEKHIAKREGFLIVALGWITISIFCTLPYLLSSTLPDITRAMFESVSGLTTTGATVIENVEVLPKGILFWRSLTQWLGGMGIIVLTVAIFPLLGIGGVELFVAESPGPTSDKIHPKIKETAKRLWLIYLGLTTTLIFILSMLGMTFFDALNHGLTTMATGGFSTRNASIAYFNSPAIEYTISLFMLCAGINYTIIYFGLTGHFKKVWRSDEFKTYFSLVIVFIVFVTTVVYFNTGNPMEQSFRESTFQIISLMTTTGYVTADYTSWSTPITLFFFVLLFVGACAGSTSGGIKVIRHMVFFKNSFLEIKRLLHPKAIIRTKVDRKIVAPRILMHIMVFLILYLMLFLVGSFLMTIVLSDFDQPILSSIGAVATSLGNVGPSIGQLGPMDNFSAVPLAGQWILVFLMLLGRLELFTILILFTPYFWRRN